MSLAGSALLVLGILSSYHDPNAAGLLSGVFPLAGLLGTGLATASLSGLYALLSREGEPAGLLWGTLGAAVVLLSLAALIFVAANGPPFGEPPAEPSRLLVSAQILSWWARPVGIALFAFALVRADILFGRALLLFLVSLLEAPLLPDIARLATGAVWPFLFLGVPGLQTGLLGAAAWAAFGLSLLTLAGTSMLRRL